MGVNNDSYLPFSKGLFTWFLLFSCPGRHKTKETYPTRPGSPTPCKQGLRSSIALFFVIIEDTSNHEGLTKLLLFLSAVLFVA